MFIMPDFYVVLKILSAEYQPYPPQGHFFQGTCGKISQIAQTYYTKKISEEKGGAIKLEDAGSGSTVTIQNSEVTKIDRTECNANTKKE